MSWGGGLAARVVACVVAMMVMLTGTFAAYSYADDTIPDFFSNPLGAIRAAVARLSGETPGLPQWVVDPSTATGWISDDSGVSTNTGNWNSKTTGRVWTDKTVWNGDAKLTNVTGTSEPIVIENDNPNDALVALSALSSAASITGTEVVTQPLDIVLLLDASSYMDAGTPITNYTQVPSDAVNPTLAAMGIMKYAVQIDGVYHDVVYVENAWHVDDASGEVVSPDTQQFYSKIEKESTKLDVLKESAESFVQSVADMNESLDDSVKHHLSIVQFGAQENENNTYTDPGTQELTSSTKVLKELGVVDDTTNESFNSAIDSVEAEGLSSALDLGMQQAQDVINHGGRDDAKKIVIVFTAGSPRHSWDQEITDNEIADPALDVAASLKDENGTDADIYTVGFFEGADSSITATWPNNLLQGISSNYPNAAVGADGIELGGRDQTNNYYFNANSAEDLQVVFEALTQAIENNGKSPLQDEQAGGSTTPGYIEFTDTLGDFMEVKDFKSVVYAGQKFNQVSSTDNDDGTVTYTFTGATEGNHVYTAGDLSDIEITVRKDATEKNGDVVTVRIPASLIPLRYYQAEVNEDKVTTDFTEADAYPIRVFYTVGVKDEVLKALDAPDKIEGLSEHIANGEATFITNQWEEGANGTTTATFTPAKDNGFYYFNEEAGTVIYSDPSCDPDDRVTNATLDKSQTYYYQFEWFDASGTWHTDTMQIAPNSPTLEVLTEIDGGWLVVPMGTPRYSKAGDFESAKLQNLTETATNAISPTWAESGDVTVALGNNGKVTHTVPGNLDISKTVEWGNGTPNADALFTFTVDIGGADVTVPGDFTYTIYEGEGTDKPVEGGTGTIEDGGTIQLKHDQHVAIEDIPGGLTYTVTETVPAGFKTNQTETTDNETRVTTSATTGTIASNQTSDVDFTNTYTLQEVTLEGAPNLKVTKTIDGRPWIEGDKFDFTLVPDTSDKMTSDALTAGAIKFDNTVATADSKLEISVEYGDTEGAASTSRSDFFGNITFTKPGVYQFVVQETVPADATDGVKDGITYTADKKIVTVTVTDDGDGTMTAKVSGDPLAFTNEYEATGKLENVAGTKNITGRDFKQGDSFTFNVTGAATTLDGEAFTGTVPMPNNTNTVTINPDSGKSADVDFGTITFTQEGIYTYTFKEQAPAGATEENNWTVNGITYDVVEKTIEVKVEDVDHNGTFTVTVTDPTDQNIANVLVWNNKYEAQPGTATVGGNKQLDGRDWIADHDSFEFKLTPADDTTKQAIISDDIEGFTLDSGNVTPLTVNATTGGNFSFAELTFNKVTAENAPYNFIIEEIVPGDASENKLDGITYDTHKAKVSVTVTDDGNGKLEATPTYSTGEGETNTFTNTYAPEPTSYDFKFGGTKTVTVESGSYTLGEGDFTFILKPVGDAPMPEDGVEFVEEGKPAAGIKVTNGEATGNSASFSFGGNITFTEAGTYRYTVSEDTTTTVPGITFDNTQYTIQVPVTENKETGELTVGEPTVIAPEATATTPSTLAFTNTFDAEKASLSIPGTKNLSGRGFAPDGDTFSFNVSVVASDGGNAAIPEDLSMQQGVSDVTAITDGYSYTYTTTATGDGTGEKASHAFNFGSITYDRAGTYTFTITENQGNADGMSYDTTTTHTVVVEVSQNDQAALTAEIVSIDGANYVEGTSTVAFTNTYSATGTHNVQIEKNIHNREWNDNDTFEFTLVAQGETVNAVKAGDIMLPGVEVTNGDEPMKITITSANAVGESDETYDKRIGYFENIQFKKAGTYTFLVKETAPASGSQEGISYDTSDRTLTITVSHDYAGGFTFSEKVTGGNGYLTFDNTYSFLPDTLEGLTVTKVLAGREWVEGDSFSFTLAADPDDPTTVAAVKNGGSVQLPGYGETAKVTIPAADEDLPEGDRGTATFGGIKFLEEGIYHFILTEDAHKRPNVSHDDATKHLTVEVTDNQEGSLVATPKWADGEQPTFTNTYTPDSDSLALQVQKTLPGAAWGNGAYTGRDWADDESFGFTVELTKGEASNVVMPENLTATVDKPASGQTGTGAFDEIQFKAEGTYEFTITETSHTIGDTTLTGDQLKSPANGMTYDGHTATVTVTVKDDPETGELVATPTYANTGAATGDATQTDVAAFTNTYAPTTVGQPLAVTKALQNRDWNGVSFDFTLTLNEQQSKVDVAGASAATAVQLPTNAASLTIDSADADSSTVENAKTDSFGDITFKAPGTYVFQVSETVPQGADEHNKYNGITYDATPRTVTITVADNGNGGLAVTNIEGDENLTFTNAYGATGVLDGAKLSVTKELTGRPWSDKDSFTFQITGVSAVDEDGGDIATIPMPNGGTTISTATADQFSFVDQGTTEKVGHFSDITFTQAGTYTYTVREITSSGNGVTVATNEYNVYVNVTDDGQGNLTAGDPVFENVTKPGQTGSIATSMHFTNTYTATDTTATVNIQKTLTGRDWEDDDAFTFELKRITADAPMPGGAQADTVTETLEPNSGDTNPATGSFDNITFTKADLGNDMSKTFEYEVKETGTDGNGLTLDKHTAKVTITVTDNGMGALSASVAYDNNTANVADGDRNNTALAAFTNAYEAQPVTLEAEADLGLAGKKVMDGREFEEDDTFTFQITEPQGSTAPDPTKTSVTITPTSGKEHTFSFGDDTTFTFDKAGTYVYYISEVNPNVTAGGSGLAGVDYDTLNYRLTVTIADNGDGQLVLKEKNLEHQSVTDPNAYAEASSLVFTNEYNAEQVKIQLRAHKTLSGRTLEAGEFGFQLVAHGSRTAGTDDTFVADATQPMPTDAEARNTTNSQNNVTFGSMTFTQDMIGKEFQYGVIELQPTQDGSYNGTALDGAEKNDDGNWVYQGVTYTHEERIITATVDSEQVSGVETVRVTTKGEPATFANTYDAADGTATIQVQKSVANRPWNQGETFGFTLKPVDGAPMPDDATELTATATTEGEAVGFQPITYTKDDLDGAMSKTFEYTVTEVLPEGVSADSPAKDGLTYATDSQTVTVTVTDNGEGVITATPSGVLQFTNTYKAADGTATIQVQKSVANRPWNQGETFGFTLKPVDGAPMPDGETELTATATAENTPASFPQITYTKADLGDDMQKIFTYTVTENLPSDVTADAPTKDGLTYATTPQTVTVTVTDNGDGTITATPSAAPTFTNTYETANGTATISIQKTLTGRDWLDTDSFSFTVTRQTENAPMPDGVAGDSVTVDVAPAAAGTAGTEHPISNATGAITFTKADLGGAMTKDFVYTVTENDTTLGGITKDAHAATVTIKVTDNANGTITAVPTYSNNAEGATEGDAANANAAAFTNTYEAAETTATLNVEKVVTGANAPEDFKFALDFAKNNQGPEDGVSGLTDNTAKIAGADLTLADDAEQDAETTSFGELTFSKAGVYTFAIIETTDDYGNGWSYDNDDPNTVTVTVEDNDDGALVVRSVKYTDDDAIAADTDTAATFTNRYTAGAAVVDDLSVTKQVEGNATDEDFTFELTLTSDNAANVEGLGEGNKTTATAADPFNATANKAATQKVTFSPLIFTEPGDYTFTVVETNTAPANTSWTYGNTPKTITVKVRDNGTGSLVVDGSDPAGESGIEGNNPTIVNRYKATGTATITVEKVIANRDWLADNPETADEYEGDSFDFALTAAGEATEKAVANGNVVMPAGDDAQATVTSDTADHRAAFGAIAFNVPGTYTFDVTEQGQSHDGLTYDTDPKQVTVEVTDNGDGTLTATVRNDAANNVADGVVTITNTYTVGGTADLPEGGIDLTKVLKGRAWNESDAFTFTIAGTSATAPDGKTAIDSIPMPEETQVTLGYADIAKNDDGTPATTEDGWNYADLAFGAITFSQPGTYVYTVTEADTGNAGMTEPAPAEVTITVTDNLHGGYTATVASVTGSPLVNVYGTQLDYSDAGGLTIVKTMSNQDIVEGEFGFTVTPDDAESAALLGLDIDTWTEGQGKEFSTHAADLEIDANGNGVATAPITVLDNAAFTHEHDGSTYGFTIAETKAAEGNGYAKDTTVYHVAIAVADDAQGTITATTTVTVTTADPAHPHDGATYTYTNTGEGATGPAQVTFTNDYDAQGALGEGAIKATKTLTNGQLMGSDFGFSVYDATGAKVASGTNAADGTITLGAIGYSTDQLMRDVLSNAADYVGKVDGKDTYTYAYTVREDTDAATGAPLDAYGNAVPGVTVNAGSFQITVTVTDNGNGELSAQVAYPQGTDHLAFRNTYGTVPGGAETLLVGGRKALDTGTTSGENVPTLADIAGKYTFTIQGSVVVGEDGPVPMPERTTATNDAAGNVTFGDIEFSIENVWGEQTDAVDGGSADAGVATRSAQRTKRFQYLVSEEGDVPGITNGVAQVFFVTVTDNGDGTVDVKCTSGNTGSTIELTPGEQFTITNEYRVAPVESSVTDAVSITKTLDGRALNEGEFTFDMALVSAPGETDPGFSVLTATNDADGAVSFPKLTFSQVGTYVYRISEEHGDLGGIAYDDSTYTATATVTDNGDGTLSVEWAVTDADGQTVGKKGVIFANTYTADPATVGLAATKVLGGRELKDGEFTFELARTGEDAPMPGDAQEDTIRLTNAADGTIAIDPIIFTQPGEYRYTLREVNGDAEGVTYDDAEHVITVTVTDNLLGALEADVSIDDGAATGIVFTNTYTAPAESDMPASGSAVAGTAVIAAMLLIAAAGIGVASKRSASRRGSNR